VSLLRPANPLSPIQECLVVCVREDSSVRVRLGSLDLRLGPDLEECGSQLCAETRDASYHLKDRLVCHTGRRRIGAAVMGG
jgi:hypothetical protein